MKVTANIEIFLFLLLLIFTKKIYLYIQFIFFVLIHELGHILTGLILGFKPRNIRILPFGFNAKFKQIKKDSALKNVEIKKILITLAGPIINIVIAIVTSILNDNKTIIYINLLIAFFNLIPIYPLDGGRVLRIILGLKFEYIKAYQISNRISNISIILLTALCSVLVLVLKNLSLLIIIIYLWYVVIKENKKYKTVKRTYNLIK